MALLKLLRAGYDTKFKETLLSSHEFCCEFKKKADLVDGKVPLDQLPPGLGLINFYDNYSDLISTLPQPQPIDTIAGVRNSQGTKWLPGNLGGTWYPKGYYRSTGSSWEYMGEWSNQAIQAVVDAGIDFDQFVTPLTLNNYVKWGTKNDSIQFKDEGISLGSTGSVNEIDFTGPGISAVRTGNKLEVNVSTSGGSGDAVVIQYNAGQVINGGKAVILDTDGLVYHMDINNSAHWYQYVGISNNAAIIGDPVGITVSGKTNVLGTGWTPGIGYYISSTGVLSSTPPSSGFCKQVGVGIDTDTINIVNYSDTILI